MKCPRCEGRGWLFDMMLNEKECYECKGQGGVSEMKKEQIQEAKFELIGRLRNTLRPSRIINLSENGCRIEGGAFPASYDHNRKELSIWGRGNRYSGSSRTISNLVEAERVCIQFFDELGGEE